MNGFQRQLSLATLILGAALMLAATPTVAAEDFDVDTAIATAKTPADHEAIAAYFDKEAAEAQAKVDNHAKMGAAYKKVGGALIAKQHLDRHCDGFTAGYAKAAKEAKALAAGHREMAKRAEKAAK